MTNWKLELIEALNDFDGSEESLNVLKNLVCHVSSEKTVKEDPVVAQLLYAASVKMRVFGYNHVNNLREDNFKDLYGEFFYETQKAIRDRSRSLSEPDRVLDSKQREIVELFLKGPSHRIMVGAPTSFGKTFLMHEILAANYEKYSNVLLVFPTNALIFENTQSIERLNSHLNMGYSIHNDVLEVPLDSRNIFVFTPERSLQLISKNNDLKIDFLFFDEVYKIDSRISVSTKDQFSNNKLIRDRTEVFRVCLNTLTKEVDDCYIAGPFLTKETLDLGMESFLKKRSIRFVPVTFEPTLKLEQKWDYSGTKKNDANELLNYILNEISGQTIVYCAGPGNISKYSEQLILDRNVSISKDVRILIDHLSTYNQSAKEEFSIVRLLKNRIGVHHGKMPLYLQKEMTRLFNDGDLDMLFCTSTMIEGVNTNAVNVIVSDRQIGKTIMSPFDLKNIIGRAGRYYHNFIGYYYLMDTKVVELLGGDYKLNNITFDNRPLTDNTVDLDNADYDDLVLENQSLKEQRERIDFVVPWDVVLENRIISREKQDKVYEKILDTSVDDLLRCYSNVSIFVYSTFITAIEGILNTYVKSEIISPDYKIKMISICKSYYNKGIKGLYEYHLKKTNRDLDKSFLNAYDDFRNIISFEIPCMITLFDSLLTYRLRNNGEELEYDHNLGGLASFLENGVKTAFGKFIVDRGFPTESINKIEERFKELSGMKEEDFGSFITRNLVSIEGMLDDYERKMFKVAISRYNPRS